MSDFLATALGLAFTLVVCLLAVHALLGPWLRLRRAPTARASHPGEKHTAIPAASRDTTPVHTA